MATQNGGPAFPIADTYTAGGEGIAQGCNGMSLRDYFAAHALAHQDIRFVIKLYRKGAKEPERIEYPPMEWDGEQRRQVHEWAAKDAYELADAMLKAREAQS